VSRAGTTSKDVQAMLDIVRLAGASTRATPWLLPSLKQLVACDVLSVSGQDTPRWTFFAEQELPVLPVTTGQAEEFDAAYQQHYWTSPCSHPDRTGDLSTTRNSDIVPDRVYRRTAMYADFDRPLGIQHEMMVCLDAGSPQRTLRLLFSRGPGADFSQRDVDVLTLLRPHLQALLVTAHDQAAAVSALTARQRQVLGMVAAGLTNAQIGRRLAVSESTVSKHLENVFERLEVTNRVAAVARVQRLA